MFVPTDFLVLSKELTKLKTKVIQAKNRSIVGRAYYALFLSAREKLKDIVEPEHCIYLSGARSKLNIHRLVINSYLLSEDEEHRDIGRTLEILRKERNKADYQLLFLCNHPEIFIIQAELALNKIKNLKNLQS